MLKIFVNAVDSSKKLENYLTDSVIASLLSGEQVYVGFYKPFSSLYLELKSVEALENSLVCEYFNGSWTSLSIDDNTNSFNRSGFIKWEKPTDWAQETYEANKLFWVRFSLDQDVEDLEFVGINLVFSDDKDLKEAYPDIMQYLPEASSSFIAYHQEARNYILTNLRNKGKSVKAKEKYKLLDQFDLHNFEEIRQASKYLALANIFANESDNVDDKWQRKSEGFFRKYSEAINLTFLSIDENDDGLESRSENQAVQYVKVLRL